jgi:aminoglycoside/choline kinase family phosphotransferase
MILAKDAERAAAITAFLRAADWEGAEARPLAGDASTRRYVRLKRGKESALLMDAPPKAESAPCPPDADEAARRQLGYNAIARLAGPDSKRFAAFAETLAARGLNAPRVHAADYDQGLLLIEDLGDELFARAIEKGAAEAPLYEAAIDVLLALHEAPAPPELGANGLRVPLLAYDPLAYKAEVDLLIEWLYPLVTGHALAPGARAEWDALWAQVLEGLGRDNASVIVLRDYHAENLFWLPQRAGLARVGLIDFQDGLSGSRAYDLVSLIEDARRDVDPALADAMLERYIAGAKAQQRGFDAEAFRREVAILGAQRNAKILGIFARLWKRDGKPGYLKLIPRVWRYMERDLSAPALAPLKAWFDRYLPAELRVEPEAK